MELEGKWMMIFLRSHQEFPIRQAAAEVVASFLLRLEQDSKGNPGSNTDGLSPALGSMSFVYHPA